VEPDCGVRKTQQQRKVTATDYEEASKKFKKENSAERSGKEKRKRSPDRRRKHIDPIEVKKVPRTLAFP